MKITGIEWDDDNYREITAHGVTIREFEDICYGLHFSRPDAPFTKDGRQRYSPEKKRFILQGRTSGFKYLDAIIERSNGTNYRPVTAYPMSEKNAIICSQKITDIEKHRNRKTYEKNHDARK
jgi:hypothetical protein